ncbi:MAG: hypothetical protein HRU34_11010 [Richelia sp.]|nr:hypothetical protein [Richelia sp.]
MSAWQGYIDKNLLGFGMEAIAIIGDDTIPRATSPGFDFKSDEIQSIIKAFEDPSEIRHHGIQIAGNKYFVPNLVNAIYMVKMDTEVLQ